MTDTDVPALRLPDDLQVLYDRVAAHMLRQGAPSVTILPKGGIACAYRGANGMKCAIGALIPDHLYHPDMEGTGAVYVLRSLGLLDSSEYTAEGTSQRAELLIALQRAHDDGHGVLPHRVVPFWEERLATIAERFGLRPFTANMLEG